MNESDLIENATVLIHIGKCGGRTLKQGLENATRNEDVHVVHVRKPPFRSDLKYIILARGPISRLQSAFRWRYRLLVTEKRQRDRFEGEYDVLLRYQTLNALAEALFDDDGEPNLAAQEDAMRIHHIREDISFYLTDILAQCRPAQIIAVLMQESLDEDIERVFGYRNKSRAHDNPENEAESQLSERAVVNLRRFFKADFEALALLFDWGKIDKTVYDSAVNK